MRDCPGCTLPLANDAICCNSCGWTKTSARDADPDWWRCVHEDRGYRCANAGSVSPSTHGQSKGARSMSGPWFCAQHVPAMQRYDQGVLCPPPMGFDGLRAQIKRAVPKPYDFEADAERLAIQQEPVA